MPAWRSIRTSFPLFSSIVDSGPHDSFGYFAHFQFRRQTSASWVASNPRKVTRVRINNFSYCMGFYLTLLLLEFLLCSTVLSFEFLLYSTLRYAVLSFSGCGYFTVSLLFRRIRWKRAEALTIAIFAIVAHVSVKQRLVRIPQLVLNRRSLVYLKSTLDVCTKNLLTGN